MHSLAELIRPTFVNTLKYCAAAYIVGSGIIATFRDLVDFLILLLS
jgi:hypothetical protein